MEVSGQFHGPAALSLRKEPLEVPIIYEAGNTVLYLYFVFMTFILITNPSLEGDYDDKFIALERVQTRDLEKKRSFSLSSF
jgi:hypothetical protein